MPHSSSLRAGDTRSIIKLVNECRDLGDDWQRWQEHWVEGLVKLIDADLGISGEVGGTHSPRYYYLSPPVIKGPLGSPANLERILATTKYLELNVDFSEFARKYIDANLNNDGSALTNQSFYQDSDWQASLDMQVIGEAYGTDSMLLCLHLVPGGGIDESLDTTLGRSKGRQSFSVRDCTVVREAVAALSPLVGGPLARFSDPSPAALAPRVRQVLGCLLEGDSDKQVAVRLGLSLHTVNQYVKVIFQHFGVRSRPELLARWIRRGWGNRFPWVD